jgi:hypothetical protein
MTDTQDYRGGRGGGAHEKRWFRDNADGTFGEETSAANRVWDTNALAWVKETQPSAGGGGGAATIADGADVAQGTTTDTSSANTVVGILKAIKAAVTGTLAVSGTFWQATQPVSLATNTPDVIDRSGRLLGHVTVDSAPTTAVTIASLPSGAVTNAGTFAVQADTELPAAAALADTAANPTTPSIGANGLLWNGTSWDRAPGDKTNGAKVQSAQLPAALGAGGGIKVDGSGTALPVSGTFFQGTQPVSLATNTPDVTDRAARLVGRARLTDDTNLSTIKAASTPAVAGDTALVVQHAPQRADAATLCVTVTAATGVAATLTIPAAGAGLFHYISLIEIQLYATTARTGGATPVLVTTTNLPGSPVWDFDTAQALGVTIRQATQPSTPIKSSVANTATTVVAPIATTGIWRITAYYYAAP